MPPGIKPTQIECNFRASGHFLEIYRNVIILNMLAVIELTISQLI
jgi:hypothetical protein